MGSGRAGGRELEGAKALFDWRNRKSGRPSTEMMRGGMRGVIVWGAWSAKMRSPLPAVEETILGMRCRGRRLGEGRGLGLGIFGRVETGACK